MKGLLIIGFLITAMPALADHPEERLDEVMAEKESDFEPTDVGPVPDLALTNENGARLTLRDLQERIVILGFVPRDCGAPCTEQQNILASVQKQVNITPMRQMVTFLTIRDHGIASDARWESANWLPAAPSNETVAESARRFAALSARNPSSPPVQVIDRRSRHAGLFHGTGFKRSNLVLYINGLTNARPVANESEPETWWDNLKELFK